MKETTEGAVPHPTPPQGDVLDCVSAPGGGGGGVEWLGRLQPRVTDVGHSSVGAPQTSESRIRAHPLFFSLCPPATSSNSGNFPSSAVCPKLGHLLGQWIPVHPESEI